MHDEAIAAFAHDVVDDLFILLGTERGEHQSLRFTTGKEGRTVGTRQNRLTDFDRANRTGIATVNTGLAFENIGANDVGFHFEEDAVNFVHVGNFGACGFGIGRQLSFHLFVDSTQLFGTALLGANRVGLFDVSLSNFVQAGNERLVLRSRLPIPSRLAGFGGQFVDGIDGHLHLLMPEHHGIEHRLFRQAIGFGLDHQHGTFGTGYDKVKTRILKLRNSRIAHEAAVDITHAASADRTLERNTGNGQSGGSTDHGRNVRVDFGINGKHVNNHLHFVKESVRKERTDRAIDQAARESFVLRRTAFTLEEAAGELTGSIGLFDVINGKREEILSGFGFLLGHNSSQNNRVAHLNNDGARSLAGDFARGERHFVLAEHEALGDLVEHAHF